MRTRSTCLPGRLRSAAIAANCSRSAPLNTTHTCCAMVPSPLPSRNIAHFNRPLNLLNDSEHWSLLFRGGTLPRQAPLNLADGVEHDDRDLALGFLLVIGVGRPEL